MVSAGVELPFSVHRSWRRRDHEDEQIPRVVAQIDGRVAALNPDGGKRGRHAKETP